jgi:hypothetical protein
MSRRIIVALMASVTFPTIPLANSAITFGGHDGGGGHFGAATLAAVTLAVAIFGSGHFGHGHFGGGHFAHGGPPAQHDLDLSNSLPLIHVVTPGKRSSRISAPTPPALHPGEIAAGNTPVNVRVRAVV